MKKSDEREKRIAFGVKGVEEEAKLKKSLEKRKGKVLIKRVDHIGIVVKNIYEALALFDRFFELIKVVHIETLPEQGVKVAIISLEEMEIEFIEPIRPETGVAKFLEKRGEGLHHLCFEVEDVEESIRNLGSKGAQLIDIEPWHGVRGKTSFVHPSSTKGVLVELTQKLSEA